MNVRWPLQGKPDWDCGLLGVHLQAFGHHGDWLGDPETRERELGWLSAMGAGHVVAKIQGDSWMTKVDDVEVARWLLDNGQVPVWRDDTNTFPTPYCNFDNIPPLVELYQDYGLRPSIQIRNEMGDVREWKDKKRPQNWREIALEVLVEGCRLIRKAGANWIFPDPLGDWYWWFSRLPDDLIADLFVGTGGFGLHAYGKSRPAEDYPEDEVSREGKPLTRSELERWQATSPYTAPALDAINAQRLAWANPKRTYHDDTVCFGVWREVRYQFARMLEDRGYDQFDLIMIMTEGGWTPDDRAGNDIRFLASTPETIKGQTLKALEIPHGMYGVCFWIYDGHPQWPYDSWLYNPLCGGGHQPVVRELAKRHSLTARQDLQAAIGKLDLVLAG